jgi:hypothetical protein
MSLRRNSRRKKTREFTLAWTSRVSKMVGRVGFEPNTKASKCRLFCFFGRALEDRLRANDGQHRHREARLRWKMRRRQA